jgi:uncharacterized protein (DUF885 family)
MHRTLIAIGGLLAIAACTDHTPPPAPERSAAPTPSVSAMDAAFSTFAARYVDEFTAYGPIDATTIGDHRYDDRIDDMSAAGRTRRLEFRKSKLAELEALDLTQLSKANRVDAEMLRNALRYGIWTEERFENWAWDPLIYTGLTGSAIYGVMARDFAPIGERMRSALARIEALPQLLAQARANLDPARVPKVHAETAAKQNAGVLSLIDQLVMPNADALDAADQERLKSAVTDLRAAIAAHQSWLDTELVPHAAGDFRIGRTLYDEKLAFALMSPLSREEIRARATAELKSVRAKMYAIARQILAGRPDAPPLPAAPDHAAEQAAVQAALELAYADRPARDAVVDTAKEALANATTFVRDHSLVTMPDEPLEIILMPEFQRGVALAYCDPPGPLDKGQETFFSVSPIPDDWTPEQVNSFLREYNTRSINDLTIHEAMPGHYLQLAHSNQYPSVLRSILWSGPFVEGWAVYAEALMAEQGYMNADPLYRLVELKWYLRAVANALLDQGLHVDGMTREEAMRLMTVETFQEEREASGKWTRAQLTSAQLPTYFVGYQEHADLRREAERRWGADFDLERYHDTVLSFGSPPARFVRALMFDEPLPGVAGN